MKKEKRERKSNFTYRKWVSLTTKFQEKNLKPSNFIFHIKLKQIKTFENISNEMLDLFLKKKKKMSNHVVGGSDIFTIFIIKKFI